MINYNSESTNIMIYDRGITLPTGITGYELLHTYPTLCNAITMRRFEIMNPHNSGDGNSGGGKSNIRECELENTVMMLLEDDILTVLYSIRDVINEALRVSGDLDDICDRVERELNLR